jgi:hypothetical protein
MKKLQGIIFLILAILTCKIIVAQPVTRKVLFLGNSYTYVNNLPQLISDAALSVGDTLIFDSNTPGGYTLDQHFTNAISTGKIISGGWDYVVMQEQSQLPAFEEYLSNGPWNLSTLTHQYNPCARKMFYMTWGRKNGDASNCAAWPPVCTYEGMDSLLRLRYIEMAEMNNAEVSPVGAVWKYIRQNYPTIELYDPDESHPAVAGSYAAACCFYAAIFRKDPSLITFDYVLNATDAANIRNVAKIIVYDSLSNWNFSDNTPVADFIHSIGTGINEVNFQNISTNADTYQWDFGDGSFSNDTNTTHNYLTDGTFTITLTATKCDLDQLFNSTHQVSVNFCSHNPTIFPDSLFICPNVDDTIWTQVYDSYQWIDGNGDSITGETNQYFIPSQGNYSVLTTLNGCVEISPQVFVQQYNFGLVFYFVDTAGTLIHPDTACIGDTLKLFLSPNKPDTQFKEVIWFNNGIPIPNSTDDTLLITASGNYSVTISRAWCPDYDFFISPTFSYTFIDCNIDIDEHSSLPWIEAYPNPSSELITVKVEPELIGKNFSILDVLGKKVYTNKFDSEINYIKLSNFDNGVYLLNVDDMGISLDFIKQ